MPHKPFTHVSSVLTGRVVRAEAAVLETVLVGGSCHLISPRYEPTPHGCPQDVCDVFVQLYTEMSVPSYIIKYTRGQKECKKNMHTRSCIRTQYSAAKCCVDALASALCCHIHTCTRSHDDISQNIGHIFSPRRLERYKDTHMQPSAQPDGSPGTLLFPSMAGLWLSSCALSTR